MDRILALDYGRLELVSENNKSIKFDYPVAVDNAANSCNIPEASYVLSSKPIRSSGGQRSQGAMLTLQQINITKFAEFLSTIQLRWANLQCTNVTLRKNKALKDRWNVDLKFKYYY